MVVIVREAGRYWRVVEQQAMVGSGVVSSSVWWKGQAAVGGGELVSCDWRSGM